MNSHLVCVGGVDHALRIPFLLALRENGFRVTAISTGDGLPFARVGLPHHQYDFSRFAVGAGEWAAVRRLRSLFAAVRPDLIQSFDTKPNLLVPLAVRGGVPVVRTINGLGWVFASRTPQALALRPAFCGLQRLASRWTTATIFQNREDKAFFETYRLLGGRPGRVIGGSGVDVDAFQSAQGDGDSVETLRDGLGLRSAEVIIFVGRLTRQKGVLTLLKAVPLVLQERPRARFVLVGPRDSEGPFAVNQALLERHAPFVLSLGPRRDVPALLGMADVFAFPTEYREGVPRALLEAGLAGLPMVATAAPGCRDVVRESWNGYLVPPRDPRALATRIVELLRDPASAKTMGRRSVPFIKRNFDLAGVVEQYCDVYARALGSGQTGGARPVSTRYADRRPACPERVGGAGDP
jgi:glycosyltransferase involved in cell wall biosynthesis